jgi:multiple sugar transport system substrate-binding protein
MTDDASQATKPEGGLTRRQVLHGSTLVMAGVAGCAGDDGGTDTPDEMTFLHFETDQVRRNTIGEIAQPWTEETGVSLNQRAIAEDSLPTTIGSDAAAGTLPATAELSNRALFSARGIVNRDDATQVVENIGEDAFYDRVLQFVSDGEGNYLGAPLYVWTQMLGYDETYRQDNDLPVPDTWDDFETFAEESHDPDNDQFGCLLGSDTSQFTLQCFQPFALSNDAHVFDEDGNIVFDEQPMVEALEFYGRMCRNYNPTGGRVSTGDVDPIWTKRQTYLYSTNTVGFWFEAAFIDEEVEGFGVVPRIDGPEKQTTFGEVVSTTTFDIGEGAREASRSFQEHLHSTEGDADSPLITFLHLRPGLFNPAQAGILNSEAYLDDVNGDVYPESNTDAERSPGGVIDSWPAEWHEEIIPNSIEAMERFGRRGDQVFPEIGDITGNFLIADAIQAVIDGEEPETAASNAAEEMRNTIS